MTATHPTSRFWTGYAQPWARTVLEVLGTVHPYGSAHVSRDADDTDVLVFGHSHIPWDTTADTGLRLVNPGSPTDRRRQPHGTFVTAVAEDGELRDVIFHPVVR